MDNLVKYIASAGISSRRQAGEIIRSGRVAVNGEVTFNPAHRVAPGEVVTCDGKIVLPAGKKWYILLHKPRGYVCSNADIHAEKLAVDLLKTVPARLVSAGRLDKDSEGAIIFSNDGEFINLLAHPRYGVLKTYRVFTDKPLSENDLRRMEQGIDDQGENLKIESGILTGKNCCELILNEGKKREIRRLTAACGAVTLRLIRFRIGSVALGDLPPGEFRELLPEEVADLRRAAG